MEGNFNNDVAKFAKVLIAKNINDRILELGWSIQFLREKTQLSDLELSEVLNGGNYPFTDLLAVLGVLRGYLLVSWSDIDSKPTGDFIKEF